MEKEKSTTITGNSFDGYVSAAKKGNNAKLMMKKEIRQLPKSEPKSTPQKVKVTTGFRRIEKPDPTGWQSTAKLFEDEEDKNKDKTEIRTLQPATVDEVFK